MITFDIDWFDVLQTALVLLATLSLAGGGATFIEAFEADHPVLCGIVSVFLALLGIALLVLVGSMKKI